MSKSQLKLNNSRRNHKNDRRVARSIKPPMFKADVSAHKIFRFRNNGALGTLSSVGISRGFLLNLLMLNLSSTTANYRLIQAIKVERVSIWSVGSSTAPVQTVAIDWVSTAGPSVSVSDSTLGVSIPAFLTSTPPAMSLAGFWSLSAFGESDNLFVLDTNGQDVIDIEVSIIFQNNYTSGFAPVSITTTASGTAGIIYGGYLDGQGAKVLQPVGMPSLT